MYRRFKYMALGALTYVPRLHAALRRGTGGTDSARYCYTTWMRHLVRNRSLGLGKDARHIAELGPGDSVGIGLAALLSGADEYIALDAVPHASATRNLQIFDELVGLFRIRADIPGDDEFPGVRPKLDDYSFPADLLPAELLESTLKSARIAALRQDLRSLTGQIRYVTEWWKRGVIEPGSLDLIYSQAVLEHVDEVDSAYEAMYQWLRPNGVMSQQIDLKCHDMSRWWNGHLAYSDVVWRIMRGRLPYLLNRATCSMHLAAATKSGFRVVSAERVLRYDGLPPERLASRFRSLSAEDLTCSGLFLQAVRDGT